MPIIYNMAKIKPLLFAYNWLVTDKNASMMCQIVYFCTLSGNFFRLLVLI